FNFTIRESILLYLSGFGIIILLDPLFYYFNKWRAKKLAKKQAVIDKHIKIAKKQGLSFYQLGPKKQHTVWAKDLLKAQKIYRDKILPNVVLHPKTEFYYISHACNNLKV